MIFVRHAEPGRHAPLARGSVVTIGAFDGIHLGHQVLLDEVQQRASDDKIVSVVVSFEPTPKEFFGKENAPARLMRFREKHEALEQRNIDVFYCPRFDRQMANLDAEEFARCLIVDQLNARHLVIGDDFRYGSARSGNIDTLRDAGRRHGFSVSQQASIEVNGVRVSSTVIRQALAAGHMEQAASYLGRWFRMSGRVIHGKHLGRELGFPTANIAAGHRMRPVHGIYAVRVYGVDESTYDGVASIGTRPSVDDGQVLLEVHLFDFDRDLYGMNLRVDFIAYLRAEEKFESLDALTTQMHDDVLNARKILNNTRD